MKVAEILPGRRYEVRFGDKTTVLTCECQIGMTVTPRFLMYEEIGKVEGDRVITVRRYAEHVSPQQVLQEVE